MSKIIVIGINGSPHKDGTTAMLLKRFLDAVKKAGGQAELVHLADYKIKPCLGCYSKSPKACVYPCIQDDDMQKIYPLLLKADAVVFASPVYWFNMSGQIKIVFDRMCCLASQGYRLEGKTAITIACSKENEGGRVSATVSMGSALNQLGMLVPPFGMLYWPGEEEIFVKGKSFRNDWFTPIARNVARNTVKLCRFMKRANMKWYGIAPVKTKQTIRKARA